MDKCIVTGRLLNDSATVQTAEGSVATFLWGRGSIKTDNYGLALFPVALLPQLRKALGRDPDPSSLEDGGRCLES